MSYEVKPRLSKLNYNDLDEGNTKRIKISRKKTRYQKSIIEMGYFETQKHTLKLLAHPLLSSRTAKTQN